MNYGRPLTHAGKLTNCHHEFPLHEHLVREALFKTRLNFEYIAVKALRNTEPKYTSLHTTFNLIYEISVSLIL